MAAAPRGSTPRQISRSSGELIPCNSYCCTLKAYSSAASRHCLSCRSPSVLYHACVPCHAVLVVDRDTAWSQLEALAGFGIGNSRANALMWTASRPPPLPGFNSTPRLDSSVKSACRNNSACDAMGMLGECCPGENAVYLGCCPKPG